jgi:hypothetical protein
MTDLLEDARSIAFLVGVDLDTVKVSAIRLELAVHKMVIAEVVSQYTLLDEILGEIIIEYFFKVDPATLHLSDEPNAYTIFSHHILDEMFLLKKMAIVHAIKALPGEVTSVIQRVNSLRNALAHSLFPEKRKEHRRSGKVLFGSKDIRTPEGLVLFRDTVQVAHMYLFDRASGPDFI